jgi:hypothetical protein
MAVAKIAAELLVDLQQESRCPPQHNHPMEFGLPKVLDYIPYGAV